MRDNDGPSSMRGSLVAMNNHVLRGLPPPVLQSCVKWGLPPLCYNHVLRGVAPLCYNHALRGVPPLQSCAKGGCPPVLQ